jgi:hypothetical protein
MKKMQPVLSLKSFSMNQSLRLIMTASLVAAISGCSSIRYNGFSEANTIFDVFSFSDEQSETASETVAVSDEASSETSPTDSASVMQRAPAVPQSALMEQPAADVYEKLAQGEPLQKSETVVENQTETATATTSADVKAPLAVATESAKSTEIVTSTETTKPVNNAEPTEADQTLARAELPAQDAVSDAPSKSIAEQNMAEVENINRLTEQNPTAAMVSDYKVLPEVSESVAEVSVPNEILLLASAAEYRPEVSEYGMWKIAKGDESLYRENCTLASATMQVSFENYSTQIWLNVVGNDLLVNSTTNIDINRPRVGIKLDNGTLQPFTKKHFSTNAVWAGDLNTALKRNKKLSVVLSGNEIGNRVQEVSVELDDLKRAYSEYTKCNATTQIGSL